MIGFSIPWKDMGEDTGEPLEDWSATVNELD